MTHGQAQGRFILFIIVGIVLLSLIGALVFILLAASANTSKAVLAQQEDFSLESSMVVRGLFSISSLRYADNTNASCTLAESYKRPVVVTLRFHAYEAPESCSIFVNDGLLRTEKRLQPECKVSCGFEQYNKQFSLGEFDYRDSYTIKVCCNQICIQKPLLGLCG